MYSQGDNLHSKYAVRACSQSCKKYNYERDLSAHRELVNQTQRISSMGEYMTGKNVFSFKVVRARRKVVKRLIASGLTREQAALALADHGYTQKNGEPFTVCTIANDLHVMGGVKKVRKQANRAPRTIKAASDEPVFSAIAQRPKRSANLQLIEDVITSNLSNDAKMLVIEKCFS